MVGACPFCIISTLCCDMLLKAAPRFTYQGCRSHIFQQVDIRVGGNQTGVSHVIWGCGKLKLGPSHPLPRGLLWSITYSALLLVFQPKQIQILACVPRSSSGGGNKVPNTKMGDTDWDALNSRSVSGWPYSSGLAVASPGWAPGKLATVY